MAIAVAKSACTACLVGALFMSLDLVSDFLSSVKHSPKLRVCFKFSPAQSVPAFKLSEAIRHRQSLEGAASKTS